MWCIAPPGRGSSRPPRPLAPGVAGFRPFVHDIPGISTARAWRRRRRWHRPPLDRGTRSSPLVEREPFLSYCLEKPRRTGGGLLPRCHLRNVRRRFHRAWPCRVRPLLLLVDGLVGSEAGSIYFRCDRKQEQLSLGPRVITNKTENQDETTAHRYKVMFQGEGVGVRKKKRQRKSRVFFNNVFVFRISSLGFKYL